MICCTLVILLHLDDLAAPGFLHPSILLILRRMINMVVALYTIVILDVAALLNLRLRVTVFDKLNTLFVS